MTPDATPRPARDRPRIDHTAVVSRLRVLAGSLVGLGVWFYLQLCALLIGWIALVSLAAGWSPVIVTGASMGPSLRPGDVLLVSPGSGEVPDGAVITFRDPGTDELVTHRVVGRDDDGLRTKGDANVETDPRPVDPESIDGVARIVVPFVGLPVVWLRSADWTYLGSWLLVTLAALVTAGIEIGSRRKISAQTLGVNVTAAPLRRARTIVAFVLVGQLIADPAGMSVVDGENYAQLMIVGIIVVIGGVNLLSWRIGRQEVESRAARRLALGELVIDSAVVLVLTVPGAGGPTWVLLAFPVIEAATRFRIKGALAHWALLSVVRVAITGMVSASEPSEVLARLDSVVQQSGVLLLVAVPGAYLAEQLLADIGAQRVAAGEASRRSELLGIVATAATDLTQLGADIPRTIVDATVSLGFDAVDVCWRDAGGRWAVLATAGGQVLPPPLRSGSPLRNDSLPSEMVIDGTAEGSDLGPFGLQVMSVHRLAHGEHGDAVLRAASVDRPTDVEQDAIRLLAAQAQVALRNEGFVTRLREANEELVDRVVTDQLTGLANRSGFTAAVEEALRTTAAGERVVLVFIDLDGFKSVNDSLGHHAGDRLLVEAGRRLAELVGNDGVAGRLGGDEFVAILPRRRDRSQVERLATAICDRLGAPYPEVGESVRVSASIGLAHGTRSTSAAELSRNADAAMYAAKRSGKARWMWHDPELSKVPIDPRKAALVAALNRDQINVSVRVSREGGRVVGVSPAASWTSPTVGSLGEESLIALSRELGMESELAEHVLTATARLAAAGADQLHLVVDRVWVELLGDSAEQFLRRLEANADGRPVPVLVEQSESGRTPGGVAGFTRLGRGRAVVTIGREGSTGTADWVRSRRPSETPAPRSKEATS